MNIKAIAIIALFYAGLTCPMAIKLRKKEIDMYRDKAIACTIDDSEIEKARAVIAQLKRDDIRIGNPAERKFEEALKECLRMRSIQARTATTPTRTPTAPTPTPVKQPSNPEETTISTTTIDKKPKTEKIEEPEFDTFEDIANAVETALAEIESLIEQIPGIENVQSKKESIVDIQNKITELKPLLDLLKKKSCGAKQQQRRKKLFKRYTKAKDAVNELVVTESQEDLKHAQEQQVLTENDAESNTPHELTSAELQEVLTQLLNGIDAALQSKLAIEVISKIQDSIQTAEGMIQELESQHVEVTAEKQRLDALKESTKKLSYALYE